MPMNVSLSETRYSARTFFLLLFVITMIWNTVSCTTNNRQPSNPYYATQQANKSIKADEIEKLILDEYKQWQGTRHMMGGTDSKGIDCSGFVKVVYREVFNIDLPRTTREQVKQGKALVFRELQPGDLVFFKPPTYARHVGIYISRSKFVHASKNKGVTISKIDAHYWGKYYWTARRFLPDQ